MAVSFKTFTDIYDSIIGVFSATSSQIVDNNEVSRFRGLIQAISATISEGWVGLRNLKRDFYVSTAEGTALDDRVGDFGMLRLPGASSAGTVLAQIASGSVVVPGGTILQSADGQVLLTVIATVTVSAPYSLLSVSSIEAGSGNNLVAGTPVNDLNNSFPQVNFRIGSAIDLDGIITGNLTGGIDKETNQQMRSRFADYLKSLASATILAVTTALRGIPEIVTLRVLNYTPVPGYITIIAGNEAGELTDDIRAEIDNTMIENGPAGFGWIIEPVKTRSTTIIINVTSNRLDILPSTIQSAVFDGITTLNDSLELGESLRLEDIIRAGYLEDTTLGLIAFKINSPTEDVIAANDELIVIDSVSVTVSYV